MPSIFNVIRSAAALTIMLSTFDLICEENTVRLKWNWSLVVDRLKAKTEGSTLLTNFVYYESIKRDLN